MSEKEVYKHENMLPTTICDIVCGPSNCGKTNVLISLIESPYGIRFEKMYIYILRMYTRNRYSTRNIDTWKIY